MKGSSLRVENQSKMLVKRQKNSSTSVQGTQSLLKVQPLPNQSKSRKKKKLRDQRLKTAFQILTPNASSSSNDDETQDFANFVVKKLRKYDTLTRSAVQHAIMGVLLNADMSLHQMQQPSTQAGPSNPFGVHPLVAETPISGMNLLSMPHRSQRPPPADTPSTSSTPQTTGECVPSPDTSEDELLLRDFVS